MEHKKHLVSFIFVVAMFLAVDFVTASRVTDDRRLREETYSKVQFKKTTTSTNMRGKSRRRRRLLIEERAGHVGHEDICADIIGPEWNKTKPRNGPCQTLVVWVPKKTGFTEFVNVNQQSKVEGGFSIAIFCYALHLLPYSVQPIFTPYINDKGESNGTYNQLLQHIKGKSCEAVAGDVTVRASRTQYVDFTSPYLSSEVYMLVRASHEWNQTLWTFLKPFTWRLWIAILGICMYVGLAVAILEYRVSNPKFAVPICRKLVMIIWFPISTFFFHEGKILNKNTKVVLVMWLSMIFIIVQIFTATLSAWLTLDQMRPKVPSSYENVGYQDGSFLNEFINQKYNCPGQNPVPLKNVEEYKNALSSGKVNAIFDELPYIQLFLAKYGSDYMKFGPINQESGIAFALAHGSPLLQVFSRAVINITESDIMMKMKEKYLGFRIPNGSQPNQALPQSLDIQSFIGLFVFIATLTIVAIVCSEVSLRRVNNKILPISNEN